MNAQAVTVQTAGEIAQKAIQGQSLGAGQVSAGQSSAGQVMQNLQNLVNQTPDLSAAQALEILQQGINAGQVSNGQVGPKNTQGQ